MLNSDKFKLIFPKADHNKWYVPFIEELKSVPLINSKSLSCFLATIYIETNGLQVVSENLNYSVDGLLKVFPKYFVNRNPQDYARKPEKIANLVYGNRMGNGDENSGDGYKYRGRGIVQLTGKNNYIKYGKIIGIDLIINPDLLLTPVISIRVALEYFNQTSCWSYASKGDIRSVSGIVNAGSATAKTIHGLEDRIKQYERILSIIEK